VNLHQAGFFHFRSVDEAQGLLVRTEAQHLTVFAVSRTALRARTATATTEPTNEPSRA